MEFDREKQTLEATRDFDRGPLSKKKGEAFSDAEMSTLGDREVRTLVDVAKVAKPIGRSTKAAAEANAAGGTGTDSTSGQAKPAKPNG
jgi:hypothetical protein